MAHSREFSAGYNYAKRVYEEASSGFAKKKALSRIYDESYCTSGNLPFNKGMKAYYRKVTEVKKENPSG